MSVRMYHTSNYSLIGNLCKTFLGDIDCLAVHRKSCHIFPPMSNAMRITQSSYLQPTYRPSIAAACGLSFVGVNLVVLWTVSVVSSINTRV